MKESDRQIEERRMGTVECVEQLSVFHKNTLNCKSEDLQLYSCGNKNLKTAGRHLKRERYEQVG